MSKAWTEETGRQRTYKGELNGIESGEVQIADVKSGPATLPQNEIHSAKLVLTDALIAATKPLDTSGAETIEEETEEKAED